jgi:kynurenine formamidase
MRMSDIAEFRELVKSLRNWGRWGAEDERGALNYITDEKRREAATLVRTGRSFPLSIPVNSMGPQVGAGGRINPLHFMTATGCDPKSGFELGENCRYTDDFLAMTVQGGTQWDALCHIYYDETLYNGFPASVVDSSGAGRNGIDKVHGDLVSRGALLDIARLKGVDQLADGYAISIDDLEQAEARQAVHVGEGDILVVRTGQMIDTKGFTDWTAFRRPEPGLHWRTATWLHERRVAAVAADNSMVEASDVLEGVWVPFHMLALTNLGLHLGEFWFLEDLAADCAKDDVWEFQLVAQALPITGGTGSPLNPLAIK